MALHHCFILSPPGSFVFLISFDVLTPDTSLRFHPPWQSDITPGHPRLPNSYWVFYLAKRFICRFMQFPFDRYIYSCRGQDNNFRWTQRPFNSIKKRSCRRARNSKNTHTIHPCHPSIHYYWQITINKAVRRCWKTVWEILKIFVVPVVIHFLCA